MKRTRLFVSLMGILPLALVMGPTQPVQADATSFGPKICYEEDFEDIPVGTTDLFNTTQLIWVDTSKVDATVRDMGGDRQAEYEVISGDEYAKFGGIGIADHNNLAELVTGKTYTFSMFVDMSDASANSLMWIEYQNNTFGWCGVKVFQTGSIELINSGNNLSGVSYVDHVLTFTFKAGIYSETENSYFSLTGQRFSVANKVLVDDIKIQRAYDVYSSDFENDTVGNTTVSHFYNSSFANQAIADSDGNHVLRYTMPASGDTWSSFYVNDLYSFLQSGQKYRLSFDMNSINLSEFYIHYHGNWGPTNHCATYHMDGVVDVPASDYIKGASYQNNRVTFDFIPDSSVGGDWPQLLLIFKHSANVTIDVDNILIQEMDPAQSLIIDSVEVKTNYFVGENLDLSGLLITTQRASGETQVLKTGEYSVDTSAVNPAVAGEYSVVISTVDQFGSTLSGDFKVTFLEDSLSEITITEPSKVVYQYGESLDLSGLVVTGHYLSGKEAVLTTYDIAGYSATTLGTQTITVSVGSFSKTFSVSVEDYLTSIAMKTTPKTAYNVGDTLDISGGVITATYASGATLDVNIVASMISGFNSATAGTKTITVTYESFTTTYQVTIAELPIEEPDDNGCGGTIATTSALIATLSLIGVVIFVGKKKHD